jgi:hypothetical protein
MAMTAAGRVRAVRERRRRREIQFDGRPAPGRPGGDRPPRLRGRDHDRSQAPGRGGPALDHRPALGVKATFAPMAEGGKNETIALS